MTRCLIVGGAECVHEDIENALSMAEFDLIVVVKRMLPVWRGPVHAFVTLHSDTAAATIQERRARGLSMDFETFCTRPIRGVRTRVIEDWKGSSGLLAVKVAKLLGASRIVLAGVPMDARPHFDRAQPWQFVYSYRSGWEKHLPEYRSITRSMSGWTRNVLGTPTPEWLGEALPEMGSA
jgi:hypothetical protein